MRAGEGQAPLVLCGEDPDGQPRSLPERGNELGRGDSLPAGRRDDHLGALDAELTRPLGVLLADARRGVDRLPAERARVGDLRAEAQVGTTGRDRLDGAATDVADEQARGVRPDIEDADPHPSMIPMPPDGRGSMW